VKLNAATSSMHENDQEVVLAPVPDITTTSVGALQVPPDGGALSVETRRKPKKPTTCGFTNGVQLDTAATTGLFFVSENPLASAPPPDDVSMGSADVPGSLSTAIAGCDSAQLAEKPRRRKANEPASGEPKAKRINKKLLQAVVRTFYFSPTIPKSTRKLY
jgi:hypothetical protein